MVACVYNDSVILDPRTLDELRPPYRAHDYISGSHDFRKALSSRMANRDRGICVKQHRRDRFAEDWAAADHDSTLAFDCNSVMLQQLHYPRGSGSPISRLVH